MRQFWFANVLLVTLASSLAAQTTVSGLDDLPPLNLSPADKPTFSNGTPVSQPLKAPLPEPSLASVRETSILSTSTGPIPKSWYTAEFLMLWPQGQRFQARLDSKTEHAINTGGRFAVGWSFGQTQQAGMEVSYLFAGARTSHSGTQYPRYANSYCDVSGFSCGTSAFNPASFKTTTRNWLQSWGATGLFNLFAGDHFRVHALAGYRNFLLNETFRGETSSAYQGFGSSYKSIYTNQIDRNTRFHGGELGLRSELIRGSFTLELETKVALGNSSKSTRYRNQTVTNYDSLNGPFVQYYPNDPERITQSHFAVLPEGSFKLGYQLGERARVSVGYTVIYLSDTKSKDESDLSYYAIRNDYLIQGLTMGLEWRY